MRVRVNGRLTTLIGHGGERTTFAPLVSSQPSVNSTALLPFVAPRRALLSALCRVFFKLWGFTWTALPLQTFHCRSCKTSPCRAETPHLPRRVILSHRTIPVARHQATFPPYNGVATYATYFSRLPLKR